MTTTIAIVSGLFLLVIIAIGALALAPIRTVAKTEAFVDEHAPGLLQGIVGGLLA